jgi:hypothetical protein
MSADALTPEGIRQRRFRRRQIPAANSTLWGLGTDPPISSSVRIKNEREKFAFCPISPFDELGHPCRRALDYNLNEGRFKSVD